MNIENDDEYIFLFDIDIEYISTYIDYSNDPIQTYIFDDIEPIYSNQYIDIENENGINKGH